MGAPCAGDGRNGVETSQRTELTASLKQKLLSQIVSYTSVNKISIFRVKCSKKKVTGRIQNFQGASGRFLDFCPHITVRGCTLVLL